MEQPFENPANILNFQITNFKLSGLYEKYILIPSDATHVVRRRLRDAGDAANAEEQVVGVSGAAL